MDNVKLKLFIIFFQKPFKHLFLKKYMKKVMVISLGGSLIIPEEVNLKVLREFRRVILKNTGKYKFVVVCGGGSVARKYISALREEGKNEYLQSLSGIAVTRMNARFMAYFFNFDPDWGIPHDMEHIKNLLRKEDIVFCGALRYAAHQTSDATAVKLARFFDTDFINLTNVKGLYDKNPKLKDAKFISHATREELYAIVKKIGFKPGAHTPVDPTAMRVILENKIKTYIIGPDMRQLDNLLNNKKFVGTIVD